MLEHRETRRRSPLSSFLSSSRHLCLIHLYNTEFVVHGDLTESTQLLKHKTEDLLFLQRRPRELHARPMFRQFGYDSGSGGKLHD